MSAAVPRSCHRTWHRARVYSYFVSSLSRRSPCRREFGRVGRLAKQEQLQTTSKRWRPRRQLIRQQIRSAIFVDDKIPVSSMHFTQSKEPSAQGPFSRVEFRREVGSETRVDLHVARCTIDSGSAFSHMQSTKLRQDFMRLREHVELGRRYNGNASSLEPACASKDG